MESDSDEAHYKMPKKAEHRMRAHINPFNETPFPFPLSPSFVDWSLHYPAHYGRPEDSARVFCNTVEYPISYEKEAVRGPAPSIIDIGCGYGAFLFALAKLHPTKLCFGLQIRGKVVNYVAERIRAHRAKAPGQYDNLAVVRTNTMRHLIQYFQPGSLQKIFICFADPHFKQKNHRRRVVNPAFIAEYAYLLAKGGLIYCVTDVQDLHEWQRGRLSESTMFREVTAQREFDPCVQAMLQQTDESKKVARKKGEKFYCVFAKLD